MRSSRPLARSTGSLPSRLRVTFGAALVLLMLALLNGCAAGLGPPIGAGSPESPTPMPVSITATPGLATSSPDLGTAQSTSTVEPAATATVPADTATVPAGTAAAPPSPTNTATLDDTPAPSNMLTVVVDASRAHQTIDGFGATLVPFELDNFYHQHDPSVPVHVTVPEEMRRDIARVIHQDLGFSRVRLSLTGFEPENDNDDPNTFDWSRFVWNYRGGDLMGTDPYSDYVSLARPLGLRTWFTTFQNTAVGEEWLRLPFSTTLNPALVDEYVEHVLAVALHFREIGQPFAYMALQNEPAHGAIMSVDMMKTVVARLGARLRAEGLPTMLVIPDDITPASSLEYARTILADPNARQYVGALAYHSYDGRYDNYDALARSVLDPRAPDDDPRAGLRDLAAANRLPLWMTEVSAMRGSGTSEYEAALLRANHVYDELTRYDVAAFDQMILFFIHRPAIEEALLYVYFNADGTLQRYEPSTYGYALAHFAREVVPGSVRVDAASPDPLLRAAAFHRPDGQPVVVLINNHSGGALTFSLSLRGLPSAPTRLRARVSTSAQMWQDGGNLDVFDGRLDVTLPARSITTLAP